MITSPRVMGLDLSITGTGVAAPDGTLSVIKTRTDDGDRRLTQIERTIRPLALGCDFVLLELLPQHLKAAGITGMVQGVVRATLLDLDVPYAEVPPASLKKYATGRGDADKGDMRHAWHVRAGEYERNDNMVDAAWLRIMGLDMLGAILPFTLPKVQREQKAKIQFPKGARRPEYVVAPCG